MLIYYINILILMSDTLEIFKKQLYNFTQKAKKKTNKIIGTEMEVDEEIPIETIQKEDEPNMKQEIQKVQPKVEIEEEKMSKYDSEIAPYYIGCYSDDPTNLSMKHYLGIVSNPVDCMKLGKKHGYEYVGIQQGDKCYASNELPPTSKVDEKHCGIHCNQANAGTCGGYFYNKVYNTKAISGNLGNTEVIAEEKIKKQETSNLVENYNSMNIDINNINRNLGNLKYKDDNLNICPLNQYMLAVILFIIIIVLYLIVDKLN
jgi:hypothetical protein